MTQNRESGAAARDAGLEIAAIIAEKIGAKKLAILSNEFDWEGQPIVLKVARMGNTTIGVTRGMLGRVKTVIAALETSLNVYELFRLSSEEFKLYKRDKNGGKQYHANRSIFKKRGTVVARINIGGATSADELASTQALLEKEEAFDVSNIEEAREKVLRSIVLRRGQLKFRNALLVAYAGACAVTGTVVEDIQEAAHIAAYRGVATNHIGNGLLLRADIHALFDLGLLSINPNTLSVYCSERIRQEPAYKDLHDRKLRVPTSEAQRPDRSALQDHFDRRIN